jgi:hypothetical protein
VTSHALPSFWVCYERFPKHVQEMANKNFALFKTNPRRLQNPAKAVEHSERP